MEGLLRPPLRAACPCGSRRPYQACCVQRDDAFEGEREAREAFSELMVRSLFMEGVADAVAAAWQRFWPGSPPVSWERAAQYLDTAAVGPDAWDVAAFAQWVVHDAPLEGLAPELPRWRDSDAGDDAPATLPDVMAAMLDPRVPGATRSALRLLDVWRSSRTGIFRVAAVAPGYRVELRALCDEGAFTVLDAALSRRLQPDDVVVLRVRAIDGRHESGGMCDHYPPSEAEALRAFAARELAALRRTRPQAGWWDLWRWRGERLHHYALQRQGTSGGAPESEASAT